jgi:hypothetical protein
MNRVQTLRFSTAGVRPTGRQPGELYVNWPDYQLGVINASSAAVDLIAVRFFSTLASYAIGDFVWQAGELYRAIAAVAPGAFTLAQWSKLAVTSEIGLLSLPITGGTMTGPLILAADPAVLLGAATKQYVDIGLGKYLPLTSGTLTNSLVISNPAGVQFVLNASAGQLRQLTGQTAGSTRWTVELGDGAAETGGNAGSNFSINSYTNAGVLLNTVMTVARSSGIVNFPTGEVDISVAGGPAQLNLAAPAGQTRGVLGLTGANPRWVMSLGNTVAETGGNAGSDFSIIRYSDAGVVIDTPLEIIRSTGAVTVNQALYIVGAAGTPRDIVGRTGTSTRWGVEVGNSDAETGGNAGSDFAIDRYSDAGVYIDTPLEIFRATGAVTFNDAVTMNASMYIAGAAGTPRDIVGKTGGSVRWGVEVGNSDAETGGNAGSNLSIDRYSDAGVYIDSPLFISRSNGVVTCPTITSNFLPLTGGTLTGGLNGTGAAFTGGVVADQFVARDTNNPGLALQDAGGTIRSFVQHIMASNVSQWVNKSAASSNVALDAAGSFNYSASGTGNAYKTGGGAWLALSDQRIKTVQTAYNAGLAAIAGLNPVRYTYNGNDTPTAETASDLHPGVLSDNPPYPASPHYHAAKNRIELIGLVAQDVEPHFPEMVSHRAGFINGRAVADLRSLDTSPLIFALVNAVKELDAKVKELDARVKTLEAKPL